MNSKGVKTYITARAAGKFLTKPKGLAKSSKISESGTGKLKYPTKILGGALAPVENVLNQGKKNLIAVKNLKKNPKGFVK